MTDAEAKAKKVKVVKVAKTGNIKPDLVDLTEGKSLQESPDKKAAIKALKSSTIEKPEPRPTTAKKPIEPKDNRAGPVTKEAAKGPELDKDADPETDPIAACFNERIKAGGVQNNVVEADAKRKKIPYPESLKLKLADAKNLTLELVKAEEIK